MTPASNAMRENQWLKRACGGLLILGLCVHAAGLLSAIHFLGESADFGAYYLGAWSLRWGISLYDWPAVNRAAVAAGLPPSLPYIYPPAFAYFLLPITWLPYELAHAVWFALLGLATLINARMLSDLFRSPAWQMLAALLLFAPYTLALFSNNVTCLLLTGLLVLTRIMLARRSTAQQLLVYTAICFTKLFPGAWSLVFLWSGQKKTFAKMVAAAILFAAATVAIAPGLSMDFIQGLTRRDLAVTPNQGAVTVGYVGQVNIWNLFAQLTQPGSIDYERAGVRSQKTLEPLWPLAPTQFLALSAAVALLGFTLVALAARSLARRGRPVDALWLFALGLLIVQPFTPITYPCIALPALLKLWYTGAWRWRGVAAFCYLMIGLSRFNGLLTALSSALSFSTQFAAIALLVLCISLVLYQQVIPVADDRALSPL